MELFCDLETYSSVDLIKSGLYKYVEAPDFEILLFAYALDGAPIEIIDLAQGERIPEWLLSALIDLRVVKCAHNAAFEMRCLSRYLGMELPLEQWNCTMMHSLYCGYPASLDAVGRALELPVAMQKKQSGKALINLFSKPCKPTATNGHRTRTLPQHEPDKWALFKDYCVQDVAVEREIHRRLSPFHVPARERALWRLDQICNLRGVALDTTLVDGALELSQRVTGELVGEAVQLSGVENPKSVAQIKGWIEEETGEGLADLTKGTVKELIDGGAQPENVHRILEIRQELGKTSTKKYDAMRAVMCADGRAHGLLQFYGANRTGRYAGRLVQVQNLPRTHLDNIDIARRYVKTRDLDGLRVLFGSVPDTLSQLIRTAFIPDEGKVFIDADFSAIEARVIAWLAGESWVLDVFRTHGKIYEAQASQMFGVPLERIARGNPEYELRQSGKVATLALGYQGGVNALTAMDVGKVLKEEEKPEIVERWRVANPSIVDLWYRAERAAMDVIRRGGPVKVSYLEFNLEGDQHTDQLFLTIDLPVGRKLYYAKPHFGKNRWGNDSIQYMGMDQETKKWGVKETYGGKLVENCVQAIARDCLTECIQRLEAAGYPIVFHVHDEIIIENDKADLENVCSLMSQPIDWARGLPLGAEGWVGTYYRKE